MDEEASSDDYWFYDSDSDEEYDIRMVTEHAKNMSTFLLALCSQKKDAKVLLEAANSLAYSYVTRRQVALPIEEREMKLSCHALQCLYTVGYDVFSTEIQMILDFYADMCSPKHLEWMEERTVKTIIEISEKKLPHPLSLFVKPPIMKIMAKLTKTSHHDLLMNEKMIDVKDIVNIMTTSCTSEEVAAALVKSEGLMARAPWKELQEAGFDKALLKCLQRYVGEKIKPLIMMVPCDMFSPLVTCLHKVAATKERLQRLVKLGMIDPLVSGIALQFSPSPTTLMSMGTTKDDQLMEKAFLLLRLASTQATEKEILRITKLCDLLLDLEGSALWSPPIKEVRKTLAFLKSMSEMDQISAKLEETWLPSKCGKCNTQEQDKSNPFKVCGRCKKISYCSPSCQRTHWQEHKKTCIPA